MTGPDAGESPAPVSAEERVVSAVADADDRVIEGALRPKRLSEVVG